jgi:hypothetical protein
MNIAPPPIIEFATPLGRLLTSHLFLEPNRRPWNIPPPPPPTRNRLARPWLYSTTIYIFKLLEYNQLSRNNIQALQEPKT